MNLRMLNIIKVWLCCCYSGQGKYLEKNVSLIQIFRKYQSILSYHILCLSKKIYAKSENFMLFFYFMQSGRHVYKKIINIFEPCRHSFSYVVALTYICAIANTAHNSKLSKGWAGGQLQGLKLQGASEHPMLQGLRGLIR